MTTDELMDIQRRFNDVQNLMFEHMYRSAMPPDRCPCGETVFDHCVNCGACVGGECNESHLLAAKFGYVAPANVLDAEFVLDDILDAETVE